METVGGGRSIRGGMQVAGRRGEVETGGGRAETEVGGDGVGVAEELEKARKEKKRKVVEWSEESGNEVELSGSNKKVSD